MVYFLQNDKSNIKIGYTKDVKKRKKELETGNDHELKLLAYIPEAEQHFEHHLHGICNRFHIEREWYNNEVMDHLTSIEPIGKLITFFR